MCATVRDIDSEMLYLALSHLIIMLPVFRNVFFNIFFRESNPADPESVIMAWKEESEISAQWVKAARKKSL